MGRLLRCRCLRGGGGGGQESQESQESHRRRSLEAPGPPCPLDRGPSSVCMDTIHITVEDTDPLGLDNPGFSLAEEGVVPASSSSSSGSSSVSIARSVSACQTAMKKRRLKALCSLPLVIPLVAAAAEASGREEDCHRDEEGEEEEEEDENMWYLQGDAEVPLNAGGLLPPPIITLIPPTPSNIVDDDDDDTKT